MDHTPCREGMLEPGRSALWADYYALTMAQAFFTDGRHNMPAIFHAFVRKSPFDGSYLLTGGQNIVCDWLEKYWRFDADDLALLRSERVADAQGQMVRVFSDAFIDFIAAEPLRLTIDAMKEGEIAFADEPIYRVSGPMWQCLMVEAAILNLTNSQSLFATLASHLVELAGGKPVMEFGLRRGQAAGGLEASRGAWLGGVVGTSNMLARKMYGIPGVGTMAHAFVMAYENEIDAFAAYARAMPQLGVFLVDTYASLDGVRRAIEACRHAGIALKGVRLDSGDMRYLAQEARRLLDAGGYRDAKIIASDGLSYKAITKLQADQAPIDVYAIGGYLVTSPDQPTLNAVYKLAAVDDGAGMRPVLKLSEAPGKITIPGAQDVVRYLVRDGDALRFDGDTIVPLDSGFDVDSGGRLVRAVTSVDKLDDTNTREFPAGTQAYRPLVRMFDAGQRVFAAETLHVARARAQAGLQMLEASHKGMPARYAYRVGIEQSLHLLRKDMIRDARRTARGQN